MTADQQKLFNRADHSNRGREFENELMAVHDFYRLQRLADIVKNPSEWVFITNNAYDKKSSKYSPGHFARTDIGQRIMRVRSDVDFSGGGKNFSICFDAKESQGKIFPLSNVHPHQIHRLRQSSRCGTIAGFMVKMVDVDRVFFVRAELMEARFEIWQRQPGRRAKPGTASISLEDLGDFSIEIRKDPKNMLWNYLPFVVEPGD
jgi:recombination protein U